MKYFQEGGWWLPDRDEYLRAWMINVNQRIGDRLTYQRKKYLHAMRWVRERGTAVDVGAHVGLWSWQMAHNFIKVVAFEPVGEHVRCWRKNMRGIHHASVKQVACGAQVGEVHLERLTESSLKTAVGRTGQRAVMRPLDSFIISNVCLIKIDVEGYEKFVLQGAVNLLRRDKPVVVVEQKDSTDATSRYGVGFTEAVDFLVQLGAVFRENVNGDVVLSWD